MALLYFGEGRGPHANEAFLNLEWELAMSPSKVTLLVLGVAAVGLAAAVSKFATAATEHVKMGDLKANEGIFVDPKGFSIIKGLAQGDPSAQIMKLGAREVTNGAIIFRSGEKLYLVDANPGAKSMMNSFSDAFSAQLH
jgi:hypothetical protein